MEGARVVGGRGISRPGGRGGAIFAGGGRRSQRQKAARSPDEVFGGALALAGGEALRPAQSLEGV